MCRPASVTRSSTWQFATKATSTSVRRLILERTLRPDTEEAAEAQNRPNEGDFQTAAE
jgi:hypothetical protein